jgi:hypothetical protein
MKSNLKILGLALVAVFAMCAVAAGSASAAKYHSEIKTTTTHSHTTSEHIFHTNVGTVVCKTTTTHSHETGTEAAANDWTTTTAKSAPTYSSCTAFGFTAEVKMNGCEYEFGEPNASNEAHSNVICPAGKTIEIKAIGFCTMTVGAQTGTTGAVTFTNEGSGNTRSVKAVSAVSGIVYGGNCGSGTNGTYTGTTVNKGYSDEAMTKQVGIWVS